MSHLDSIEIINLYLYLLVISRLPLNIRSYSFEGENKREKKRKEILADQNIDHSVCAIGLLFSQL